MIRLEMKNCNIILPEKQQKYEHNHLEKLIYEYVTGDGKLPSDQRRVIEQAKYFTYSTLGKALGKQTKIIADQGKNQIKAIVEHGKQLVKSNAFSKKERCRPLDNKKEIFYNLAAERTGEIEKLCNSVNFQNFIYNFKGLTKNKRFTDFIDVESLFGHMKH